MSTTRPSRLRRLSALLAVAAILGTAQFAARPQQGTGAALDAALAGTHRSDVNRARDRYRHPKETLEFFGLRPDMTVVEIWPGGGWYTEVLGPVLRERGKLYVAQYGSRPPFPYQQRDMDTLAGKMRAAPDLYRSVTPTALNFFTNELTIAPPGTADLVLTFRNVHNWFQEGYGPPNAAELAFKAMFDALKPGGVLGVVDHRWPNPATEDPRAANGYVSEQRVVELAKNAGFALVGGSDVNNNPRDTRDYPQGVWTLPPDLALGQQDRAEYLAIGESDRFTLKFVKPATTVDARLDALEAQVVAAEDVAAIKRLQRTYGYYVDKGMWEDVAELYTEDAVANYPAGTYVGYDSIRKHLYMNVGGGEMGENGLAENRLYNHMNIQPVVHLDPGGQTAKGRWRAFAMFGNFGGGATWAEGVYEMTYRKVGGVWKISNLDYHSGFSAPYARGWVPPEPQPAGAPPRPARNLPHAADRPRSEACAGFPAACVGPFHYTNPGVTESGHAWTTVALSPRTGRAPAARDRAADLAARAQRLADEQEVENLQKIYGYYYDRRMWDEVADLFVEDGTIEMGRRGVYVGKARVREFLNLLGPVGLTDGDLFDHVQLQVVVSVAPDGRTAKARSRELNMTGVFEGHGEWSEGVYENTFVKDNGVWKIKSLVYFPTFITDYDQGWAADAKPVPTASAELPPDRPPTSVYAIYPKAHIPPFHYDNPATGASPRYPQARGRPSDAAIAAVRAPVAVPRAARGRQPQPELETLVAHAELQVGRVKDFHEIDNLTSAYGYYLDKNLWNDLANLFAANGSIELAQRGMYLGRERVRAFLFNVFGREGPSENRLGNHVQYQAVIHVAPDGQTAKVRSRMMQQLNFGPRASMGASLYENEFVKEDGVWKFSIDHTFNTWTAGYDGGWMRSPGRTVPGPSRTYPPDTPPTFTFQMFPTVYEIPFHYAHPVTGRVTSTSTPNPKSDAPRAAVDLGMPAEIAAQLKAIGARIDAQKTGEIYTPLHPPQSPYAWLTLARDQEYGPHERNVLDVFTTPVPGTGKPVVVFVHGGGFARGSKSTEGTPFYDNIGLWAVGQGLVGVTMNYRLAPQSTWPSGIEDLTAAVAWLKANVAQYGGDPNKIVLWGHSAGAAHVADYVADATKRGRSGGVAGAVLTSGFYDLGTEVSVWKIYYGEDLATYAERSSLPGLVATDVPLFVNDAELDPDMFREETDKLVAARAAAGKPIERVHLMGHSHISETYAVGTGDRSLSGPVLEFVRRVSPRP